MVGRYVRDESEMSPTTFIFWKNTTFFTHFLNYSRRTPEPTPNQRRTNAIEKPNIFPIYDKSHPFLAHIPKISYLCRRKTNPL